jgi:N-methylhydantoinase B
MDNDGIGSELLPISVSLDVKDGQILCDFSGSSPQVKGPINNPYFATLASIYYTLKAVLDPSLPANSGFFKAISVHAPEGSSVNCAPPAPCLFRSDVAQRVVDVVLGALAKAIPERVVAAGNGATTGVYFLGHKHDGGYYAYIETLGGGMGASMYGDGPDGVQVHTTNTSNLPVEALELEYPILVDRYELVEDSGGPGKNRGGLGILRQYRILSDETKIRTKGDRAVLPPWGLEGGKPGGQSRSIRNVDTKHQNNLNIKEYSLILNTDETLRIITPGAGGYGDPEKRDKNKVLLDFEEGKISKRSALRDYGIKV